MVTKIFISYIHEEETVAKGVQKFLETLLPSQTDVFLSSDRWKIYAGEIWLDRIRRELGEAKVVILMLSSLSVERPWVNFEAGAAWLTEKAIIPVCFGGMDKGRLPKPYSSIQALNIVDESDYLVSSVCHHLGLKPPAPPIPPPSDDSGPALEYKPYDELRQILKDYEKSRMQPQEEYSDGRNQ